MTQSFAIEGWLPAPLTNGSRGHWSVYQKKLAAAQIMVWSAAKQANLQPIKERAIVTITLVFPVKRRRDADNCHARCKGLLDGLVRGGWLVDDSVDHIELRVVAEVRAGIKATEIRLTPASEYA